MSDSFNILATSKGQKELMVLSLDGIDKIRDRLVANQIYGLCNFLHNYQMSDSFNILATSKRQKE